MTNAKHGYLIVLKPEILLKRYMESRLFSEHGNRIKEMWRAFAAFPPEDYRGTARDCLEGLPARMIELFESAGDDNQGNKEARERLYEILDKSDEDYDSNLIKRLTDAREIFSLLEGPQQWEIIEVRREDFAVSTATLGFDVGPWSGVYSLIADTIVDFAWHPPPASDYAEVARQLASLNQHLLFPQPEDAARFLAYYRSKSWAEKEGRKEEFCIIQVDQVEENQSD